MRSLEDSLQRLGTHRVDVLLIHDVDRWTHGSQEASDRRIKEVMEGGYKAMVKLREAGVIGAIGAGLNEWDTCQTLAEISEITGYKVPYLSTMLRALKAKPEQTTVVRRGGRPKASGRALTLQQERQIQDWVCRRCPDQLQLPFALWTRKAIQMLIAEKCDLKLSIRAVRSGSPACSSRCPRLRAARRSSWARWSSRATLWGRRRFKIGLPSERKSVPW